MGSKGSDPSGRSSAVSDTMLSLAGELLAREQTVPPLVLADEGGSVCRQNISDIRFGNLREYLAHLV